MDNKKAELPSTIQDAPMGIRDKEGGCAGVVNLTIFPI
jgi:hypothetical protein